MRNQLLPPCSYPPGLPKQVMKQVFLEALVAQGADSEGLSRHGSTDSLSAALPPFSQLHDLLTCKTNLQESLAVSSLMRVCIPGLIRKELESHTRNL
jgi:hypothetical protein